MTYTAADIRELLSGITAGEWIAELVGNETWDVNVDDSDPTPIATDMDFQDAHFLAAAPGIARYAQKLAERLEALERAVHPCQRCVHGFDQHESGADTPFTTECYYCDCEEYVRLAPQPAPTDGAE